MVVKAVCIYALYFRSVAHLCSKHWTSDNQRLFRGNWVR